MKKLITIILAIIMTFFSAPNQGANQSPVTAEKTPQTAITTTVEQVPEESETTAETAFVGEVAAAETTNETPKKEVPVVQEKVTEESFAKLLYTADIPDPDLIIRSGGEYRLSNFLMWQAAYSELYFTPTLWPDFDKESLREALDAYAGRQRRFGLVK